MGNRKRSKFHGINCGKAGFTLIEVLVAAILIGLAVTALVGVSRSFSYANGETIEMSTAEFLSEQIRELTMNLAVRDPQTGAATFGAEEASLSEYDDIDDFNLLQLNPPIDVHRQTLSEFGFYTQRIIVENVSASNFNQTVSNHGSSFYRISVEILYNGRRVDSTSWIRAYYN